MTDWNDLRVREFPVATRWAYFDHAAVAPLPKRSADRLRLWIDDQENNGVVNWPDWERKLEAVRRTAAKLIKADRDEIAFITSTTQGIGIVAEGFPWRNGDNVVTAAEEYPSNVYPWMNLADRGVALRMVPTRDGRIWIEDLDAAIDSHTRLLTISHVEFASGFRNDLNAIGELCRKRGIAFFVDAIQGLGPLEIDVQQTPIDFLAADGHKWLLGPEGAGIVYIKKEWIDRLRPIGVGWHSVINCYDHSKIDFRLKPSAQRWEGGSFNMPGIQALGASLELIDEIGAAEVSRRILDRAEAAREVARQAGWSVYGSSRPEDRSGIVSLEREGVDPKHVAKQLRDMGIATACRGGRLRLSPHIYNNQDDFDRLREAFVTIAKNEVAAPSDMTFDRNDVETIHNEVE
jgi:cysteine desulfurase/selenocysteine lyase